MMKRQAESFTRSMVHRKTDELIPKLYEYVKNNCPEDTFLNAWDDFVGIETGFEETPYQDLFFRWFVFLWIPEDAEDSDEEQIYPSPHTIGAAFLKNNQNRMDSLATRVLEAALRDPLSFWQVEAVEANRGVFVKDLLLGRECFVDDVVGSHHLKKWDIVLANMQELDGVHVFNITGPFSLPPTVKASIHDSFSIDPNAADAMFQLFDFDLDLLMFYQSVIDELFAAPMPELRNMDGTELIETKSVYKIDPAIRDEIVMSLSNEKAFEPLEEDAQSNDKFIWADTPENPSLLEKVIKGHLDIGRDKLITKCNSAERDQQLRKVLKAVLGEGLAHQKTISNPIDFTSAIDTDHDEIPGPLNLDELPGEVRGQMIEQLEGMYLSWADESVPALDHQTPREAVKSTEVRIKVIDLIKDWENQSAHMEKSQFQFDFNRLRDDLGLPRE
jgi:hypothetical protein